MNEKKIPVEVQELSNDYPCFGGLLNEYFYLKHTTRKNTMDIVRTLREFFNFIMHNYLAEAPHPNDIQAIHFSKYLHYLENVATNRQGNPLAQNTISARLTAVKSLWSFLYIKGFVTKNESTLVKYKKTVNKRDYTALTPEQVNGVLNSLDIDAIVKSCIDGHKKKTNMKKYVAWFTFKILVHTGLRESEIASLQFKNLRSHNGIPYIDLIGKGQKYRQVPVCSTIVDMIDKFKSDFHKIWGIVLSDNDYVIQSAYYSTGLANKESASTSTIFRLIKLIVSESNLDLSISPHDLRATYVTQMLNEGVPVYQVSQWAGHANINTTKTYDKDRNRLTNAHSPKFIVAPPALDYD
ncbi:tyrosine-type recombinase/integrase [Flavobacterium alkalisoli]|uniref:tyrosine-type recombinase/integrase n=1 Tax=Flavobacterium alkalisoli TaxID=2602769 RepID=UPI003A8D5D9E